jgi:hypothetical protein
MRSGTGTGTGTGTTDTATSTTDNNNNKLAMDKRYVSSELIETTTSAAAGRLKSIPGKKSYVALERLAQREQTNSSSATGIAAAVGAEDRDDDFDSDGLEEPAGEEDGEDYTTNHYASDDDGGDGGEMVQKQAFNYCIPEDTYTRE